jgi:hypothetical protein
MRTVLLSLLRTPRSAPRCCCGIRFIDTHGNTLTCIRPRRPHLIHHDQTGTRFLHLPGGAWIWDQTTVRS